MRFIDVTNIKIDRKSIKARGLALSTPLSQLSMELDYVFISMNKKFVKTQEKAMNNLTCNSLTIS